VCIADSDTVFCPSVAMSATSLAVDPVFYSESVLVGSVDCPVVEDIVEKDYSVVLDDFADLDFLNICFPDSLDNCDLYDALDGSELFEDNFVPTVDDANECLFIDESLIVPVLVSNDFGPSRFGTVTEGELENVRRGGIHHFEASKYSAARAYDDW
jgi:hypothetical protein